MPLRAQVFRHYETVVLMHPDTPTVGQDSAKTRMSGVIESAGGKIARWETWGKRRLAFEVQKQNKAHYHYVNFVAPQMTVAELERNLRIMEPILMFQTVKLEDQIDVAAFDFEGEAKKKSPLYLSPEDAAAIERNYQREREWAEGGFNANAKQENEEEAPASEEKPAAEPAAAAAEEE